MVTLGHMVKQIISVLEEFASPDYQRRQWVNAEDKTQIAFYVESFEAIYDFNFVDVVEFMRGKEIISVAQAETALGFIAALETFAKIEKSEGINPYNDAAIIAHPAWPSVVESAVRAIPIFVPFQDSQVVLWNSSGVEG
jgi:hypothetical protein